jgi:hypothetical protein
MVLAISRLSHATALGIVTESFYSNERMSVSFPRADTNAPIPRVLSRREWEKVKTTKFDVTGQLVSYLLSSDIGPRPSIKNGTIVIPELDPTQVGPRTRKVLIYQEWSLFVQRLMDVSLMLFTVQLPY